MSDNVKCLGYDRDGAEVWEIAPGIVVGGTDVELAEFGIVVGGADVELAECYASILETGSSRPGIPIRPGIPLASYERQFGPITKEKP